MAPRTIYTLGGRYKTIDAVEDAPFGEFITVRDTGLVFNVVHPIPEQYIRALNALEREKVREYIASQLSSGGYESDRFARAAAQSVTTLDKVQRERDQEVARISSTSTTSTNTSTTDTSTTDTESTTTVRPTAGATTQRGTTSGIGASGLHVTMSGLSVEPIPRTPAPERYQLVDSWEDGAPAGFAPPSVSEPSEFTWSNSDGASLSSSLTRPREQTRHISFDQDPSLGEDARMQEAVERHTADRELALHEGHLEDLSLLSSSMTDLAARLTLSLAINRARTAVENLRGSMIVTKAALAHARHLTVAAMDVADSLQDQATTVIENVTPRATTRPSPGAQPVRWSTPTPTPRETPQVPPPPLPANYDDGVYRIQDELRGINDNLLYIMETSEETITRDDLLAKVIERIHQAFECIDVVRSGGVRQGSLDHTLVREVGRDVLRNAREMQQRAMSVFIAAQEEESQLHEAEETQGQRRQDASQQGPAGLREEEHWPHLANLREREFQQAGVYNVVAPPPYYDRASEDYPGFTHTYPSPRFYSFDPPQQDERHELERLQQEWRNGTLRGNQRSEQVQQEADDNPRRLAHVRRDRRHPHRRSIRVQVPGREPVYYDLY